MNYDELAGRIRTHAVLASDYANRAHAVVASNDRAQSPDRLCTVSRAHAAAAHALIAAVTSLPLHTPGGVES